MAFTPQILEDRGVSLLVQAAITRGRLSKSPFVEDSRLLPTEQTVATDVTVSRL